MKKKSCYNRSKECTNTLLQQENRIWWLFVNSVFFYRLPLSSQSVDKLLKLVSLAPKKDLSAAVMTGDKGAYKRRD